MSAHAYVFDRLNGNCEQNAHTPKHMNSLKINSIHDGHTHASLQTEIEMTNNSDKINNIVLARGDLFSCTKFKPRD